MTTTTTSRRALGLARHDKVYSQLHHTWVRFLGWADADFAEVCDAGTMRRLPDLVHLSQLSRTPTMAR